MVNQHYENLKRILSECETDVLKAAGGNKAAALGFGRLCRM